MFAVSQVNTLEYLANTLDNYHVIMISKWDLVASFVRSDVSTL